MISEKFAKLYVIQKNLKPWMLKLMLQILVIMVYKNRNLDFIIINESELRHDQRRHENIKNLMIKLASEKNIKYLTATSGKSGALLSKRKKNFFIVLHLHQKW